MNKDLKIISSVLLILSICGCSSYRENFGGYKYNHHLNAMESKSISVRDTTNVRAKNTKYNIPKIKSVAIDPEKIESLEKPVGF